MQFKSDEIRGSIARLVFYLVVDLVFIAAIFYVLGEEKWEEKAPFIVLFIWVISIFLAIRRSIHHLLYYFLLDRERRISGVSTDLRKNAFPHYEEMFSDVDEYLIKVMKSEDNTINSRLDSAMILGHLETLRKQGAYVQCLISILVLEKALARVADPPGGE